MNEIEEKFAELEKVMDKYDLYQEGDEVRLAINELKQALITKRNNRNWK